MKLSTTAEYGFRALIHLAENQTEKPYPLAEIARKEQISMAYLEKIFAKLRDAGIIMSVKGVQGGYLLAKPQEEINFMEIIYAIEGNDEPYGNLVEQSKAPKLHCKSHLVWSVVQQKILKTLSEVKLIDVVNK
jgi:Rrf2 family iron-sulfur cluster assembly transcriptional regulator